MCFNQGIEDTSDSSNLSFPDYSNVTFRRGISDPGNPIYSVHLPVLNSSALVHVLKGFLQFFNCLSEVTYAVRPHQHNAASSSY